MKHKLLGIVIKNVYKVHQCNEIQSYINKIVRIINNNGSIIGQYKNSYQSANFK